MSHISQSAFALSPAAAGLDFSTEIIVCNPFGNISEYQGTRSALEAEGVAPPGSQWPDGFKHLRWEDGNYSYWLHRERPKGAKGPRTLFIDVDWWMFSWIPLNATPWPERVIKQKAKELNDEIYRQSVKGRAEQEKQWEAYWAANRDEKFQAFKALIPGVIRPRRGRSSKNDAKQSQGEAV